MCLRINKHQESEITENDITCYKRLEYNKHCNAYITPYMGFRVILGKTYKAELRVNTYNRFHDSVNDGIHSYAHKEDAMNEKCRDEVVVKCVIPKGSSYFFGGYNDFEGYASNQLTYIIEPSLLKKIMKSLFFIK